MKGFIKRFESEESVIFHVEGYRDSLDFLEGYSGTLDVIFIDIEMPHMDGMTVCAKIREMDEKIGIVFVTNMAQYAIKGYEVNAIDFIVKPVSYYVFADKLKKAIRFTRLNADRDVVLNTEDSVIRISSSGIYYIEKNKNYLLYHTSSGIYKSRGTMQKIREEMSGEGFAPCSSGCIVNLRHVEKLQNDVV